MELRFKAKDHSYTSPDYPEIKWISVTGIVHHFKEPFDPKTKAISSSQNPKSKWYGKDPKEIEAIWAKETDRSIMLGSWYHDQREKDVLEFDTIQREGLELPIIRSLEQEDYKVAPDQNLVPGIYPEHFMYLASAGICGQADRVEIIGDRVDIYDYKTNKEIKTEGYRKGKGPTQKMLFPVNHLDDCHLMHYALQLSFYMYMILKHNHNLVPGKLIIHHIAFEIEKEDENGYPIVATDLAGDPIVKKVTPYEVPYLKKEVEDIIKRIKLNPKSFIK